MLAKSTLGLNRLMHICHALFTASLGGIEAAYVKISKAFADNGHRVTALLRPDAPYIKEIQDFADVVCVQPSGFYDLRALWRTRRMLGQQRPNLVLAHAPRAIALLGYAAIGTGIPMCGVLHSYRASRIRHADHLVVLTEDMRRFVASHGFPAQRTHIIPNMVRLRGTPPFRELRHPLTLGAMGRLVPEKGFPLLLDVMHLLKAAGVEARLRLAGKGPEEAALREKAAQLGVSDLVNFDGWVQDKEAFFREIDVFCLPSLEESFGIVLLEAMAQGVPIVSTATPGPQTILTNGLNGRLVQVGNAQAFADAVRGLSAGGEAAKLARHAWERVQDFSMERVSAQWLEFAQAVISEGRQPAKRSA